MMPATGSRMTTDTNDTVAPYFVRKEEWGAITIPVEKNDDTSLQVVGPLNPSICLHRAALTALEHVSLLWDLPLASYMVARFTQHWAARNAYVGLQTPSLADIATLRNLCGWTECEKPGLVISRLV